MCTCCLRAHARLLDYELAATEIASGTWAVHGRQAHFDEDNGGNIVNVAFIDVGDGVVVVDTGPSRRYGEALRALIARTVPGKPILRVYITHHHPDHCFGNQAFDASRIAAPAGVVEAMRQEGNAFADNLYRLLGDWMRGTEPVLPGRVLAGDAHEMVGGRRFDLYYLAGHTRSDFVLRDAHTGVLFAGDLAFLYRAPTTPHADIALWQQSLAQLAGIDRAVLLPGHGPGDTRNEAIEQTGDYLDWLDSTLRRAVRDGLSMNEAMALPIPSRLQVLDVVQAEYRRSVAHLYAGLEDALVPPVTPVR